MSPKPGTRNLITDVAGIRVGQAQDQELFSGVSVILPDEAAVAGVHIAGGAPGTRETQALEASCLVDAIHGLVLAGGSVFGLDAASGVTHCLAKQNRGFAFRTQPHVCPVVPAAVLFDLTNGGNKQWGELPPYRDLGIAAAMAASEHFELGNYGAGLGATAGIYKGGVGSASIVTDAFTVGGFAAVNSFGSPVIPGTDTLWAQLFAHGDELGGQGEFTVVPNPQMRVASHSTKASLIGPSASPGQNTTLCVVATDAILTPAEAHRIGIMASDGMARAIRPVHTPFDGDVVFVLSTGKKPLAEPRALALSNLGTHAGDVVSRAIARGVYEAETVGKFTGFRQRLE